MKILKVTPWPFLAAAVTVLLLWSEKMSFEVSSRHMISPVNDEILPLVIKQTPHDSSPRSPPRKARTQKRPHFILHVGPQKAISTTLQCEMYKYKRKGALRWRSKYMFIGKLDSTSCRPTMRGWPRGPILDAFYDCGKEMAMANDIRNVTCWNQYLQSMDTLRQHGQGIIGSEEKFSEYHAGHWRETPEMADRIWKELKKSLEDWDVDLIIIYRRYYSWLASLKNQGDKYVLGRVGMKRWRGPTVEPIFPHMMDMMTKNSAPSPYVDEILREYRDVRGFNVTFLNMHDGTDIMETIFCGMMRNANKACTLYRRSKRNAAESGKALLFNPSINPFYDIISHQAQKRKLLNLSPEMTRPWVSGEARIYQEETLGLTAYDFPLICPTDADVQPLLEKTLKYEKELLPDFFHSPLGEQKLREVFWKDVRSKKFCTVDFEKVLADPTWISFFSRLIYPTNATDAEALANQAFLPHTAL